MLLCSILVVLRRWPESRLPISVHLVRHFGELNHLAPGAVLLRCAIVFRSARDRVEFDLGRFIDHLRLALHWNLIKLPDNLMLTLLHAIKDRVRSLTLLNHRYAAGLRRVFFVLVAVVLAIGLLLRADEHRFFVEVVRREQGVGVVMTKLTLRVITPGVKLTKRRQGHEMVKASSDRLDLRTEEGNDWLRVVRIVLVVIWVIKV